MIKSLNKMNKRCISISITPNISDEQNARLKWFCKKILGKELDLNDFDEKLIVQKAVYLAQKMGMEFNYTFGWYVRGVYSSSLTVGIYEIHDVELPYSPSDEEIDNVDRLLSIKFESISQGFELVSSIVYAKFERYMNVEKTKEFIKSVKPWFSNTDIDKALNITEKIIDQG